METPELLPEQNVIENLEHERLFGSRVDLYVNLNKCQILERVVQKATIQTIFDNDTWRTLSEFLKRNEAQELLDTLIKSKTRQRNFISRHGCYDFGQDLLEALYIDIRFREKIWQFLGKVLNKRVEEYTAAMSDSSQSETSILHQRFNALQTTFNLNEYKLRILMVIFLQQSNLLDLGDFSTTTYNNNKTQLIKKLSVAVGLTENQTLECFSGNSTIRSLVDEDLEIESACMDYLYGTSDQPLTERMWIRYEDEPLPWDYYGEIATNQGMVLRTMIESKPADTGLSILFYGKPGTGKTSFAATIGKVLGKEVYFIAQSTNMTSVSHYSANFRYAALAAAKQQLSSEQCILVVDECDDMIESQEADVMSSIFSMHMKRDGAEAKGQLNNVIDMNRHIVIWICNSQQEDISVSSRRRFDYSVHFDDMPFETRLHIWENSLKLHGCENMLPPETIAMLAKTYNINAGGVAISVKNASNICKKHPDKSFLSCVNEFLKSHCELMGIDYRAVDQHEPTRDYTLEGLNIHSGVSLEKIIKACRFFIDQQAFGSMCYHDTPRMNILLHGISGSGKTEFVKFLASKLNKKLKIKTAADLLGSLVGETEKNIVSAFTEARQNNEILFFDEGDSLLYPRNMADRSWEITQVNTLLSEMENFNGIFVISTNFIQRLDGAVLRRFTFRIHFDYLKDDGKIMFYNTYFKHLNIPELSEKEKKELCGIQKLTPSDFRNVRQQFFYLDRSDLTNAAIIAALREETLSRDSQNSYKNLGEERHVIGFDAK